MGAFTQRRAGCTLTAPLPDDTPLGVSAHREERDEMEVEGLFVIS